VIDEAAGLIGNASRQPWMLVELHVVNRKDRIVLRSPAPALIAVPPPVFRWTVIPRIRVGEVRIALKISSFEIALALRVLHAELQLVLAEEMSGVVGHIRLNSLAARLVRLDIREAACHTDALRTDPFPPVDESRTRVHELRWMLIGPEAEIFRGRQVAIVDHPLILPLQRVVVLVLVVSHRGIPRLPPCMVD